MDERNAMRTQCERTAQHEHEHKYTTTTSTQGNFVELRGAR